MILTGRGDATREGTDYVVRGYPNHLSGRDIARHNLHRPVNEESLLGNILFGLFITGTTFFMLWVVWRGMAPMFLKIWQGLSS